MEILTVVKQFLIENWGWFVTFLTAWLVKYIPSPWTTDIVKIVAEIFAKIWDIVPDRTNDGMKFIRETKKTE